MHRPIRVFGLTGLELGAEARIAADQLRASAGLGRWPVDPWTLCRQVGIEIVRRRFDPNSSIEAVLVPRDGRTLRMGIDDRPTRNRSDVLYGEDRDTRFAFRAAHEIGHSLFFRTGDRGLERTVAWTSDEERFCDCFASELLMPESVLQRVPTTADALLRACRTYRVPLRPVADRIASARPAFAAGVWQRRESGGELLWIVGEPDLVRSQTTEARFGRRSLIVADGSARPAEIQGSLLVGEAAAA